MLKPYAVSRHNSRGRRYVESEPQYRDEFQRDRDRIVHSGAFRRLEYKTQVFVNHEGDMFRTRLTHSIEVAQIARSIARVQGLNEDLAESIALAHDLGHTPFGHAGQDALNDCMREFDGFEHNLQSLRVVDKLEERYAEFSGLNLVFETREGILKHCSKKNAAQLGDVAERFLQDQQPSLEAQLTNMADQIAYNNHDIDDGLRAGLITFEQLMEIDLFSEQFKRVEQAYAGLQGRRIVYEIIRRMINRQIVDIIDQSRLALAEVRPETLDDIRMAGRPLIGFSDEMREMNQQLKQFLREKLYQHYRVRRMSTKARGVLTALFDVFMDDRRLLPDDYQYKASKLASEMGEAGHARVVSDYIAGMTDRYAIREYGRLFDPAQLT